MEDQATTNKLDMYKRAYEREKRARKEAERILEVKSRELYYANKRLADMNYSLEQLVEARTKEIQDIAKFPKENPHPVFRVNDQGQIMFANEASSNILRYFKSKVGDSCPELIMTIVNEAFEAQESIEREVAIGEFYFSFVFTPIQDYVNVYGRNVTDKRLAELDRETLSLRLSTLIKNLQSAILLENEDREIVLTNENFCHLFQLPTKPHQMVGVDCSQSAEMSKHLFKNPAQFVHRIEALLKRQVVCSNEELEMVDGSILERDYIPIFSNDQYLGHLWQYRDITARKNSEKQLLEAKVVAEESVKMKQHFIANVSHEIRTPMSGILGMSKLLEGANLTGKHHTYLKSIQTSAKNLLIVINDILDFSKIDAGKMEFEAVGFIIPELIQNLSESISYKTAEKDLSLTVNTDSELQGLVTIGDPYRLNQVLMNLVGNAIKFTETGEIKITAKLLMDMPTHATIGFSVSDTGIGISPSRLKKIFDSFNQADASITRRYGGTGLGLPICKKIVELQGGRIHVESGEGKGTTFSFTLSFPKGTQTDLPSERDAETGCSLSGYNILLVEDNVINQLYATAILEKWGTNVSLANNGQEAINLLNQQAFDIILMDIQMPIMNGLDATKYIRNTLKLSTPIIALTANAIKGEAERYKKAGMDTYVSKPFEEYELQKAICELLYIDMNAEQEMEATPPSSEVAYGLSKLEKLSDGNDEFITKMIHLFVTETPKRLAEIETGLQTNNYEEIRKTCHTMKPSLEMFQAEALYQQAKKLERNASNTANAETLRSQISDFIQHTSQLVEVLKAKINS
ncbi:MAG: ATP-binding protein [Flammeovirgaceae bacterium]